MKILLDENLPHQLKSEFPDHQVFTIAEMRWAGKKNGELLRLMKSEFDVFLTVDKNLQYQQNLTGVKTAIILMRGVSNRLESLLPLIPQVKEKLLSLQPGTITTISAKP